MHMFGVNLYCLILYIQNFILFIVIVCTPSICMICNAELALDNSGMEKIFCHIPVQEAISFEKAKISLCCS